MGMTSLHLLAETRTDNPGAYIETQWSACQATGEQCLLDSLNPHDPLPTLPPQECKRGSVPDYFVRPHVLGFTLVLIRILD